MANEGRFDYAVEEIRLAHEGDQAFAAFTEYCRYGPKRSLAKIAIQIGKSVRTLEDWSSKYDWVNRAATYDSDLERSRREAIGLKQTEVADKAISLMLEVLDNLDAHEVARKPFIAVKLLEVVSRIARLESGQATDIAEVRGGDEAYAGILKRLEADAQQTAVEIKGALKASDWRNGSKLYNLPGEGESTPNDG